jgi:hypothetical protein
MRPKEIESRIVDWLTSSGAKFLTAPRIETFPTEMLDFLVYEPSPLIIEVFLDPDSQVPHVAE